MIWFTIVVLAVALLAFLLMAQRRYERESAGAALEQVEAMRSTVESLRRRIEILEAIASETEPSAMDRLDLEAEPEPPEARAADASARRAARTGR